METNISINKSSELKKDTVAFFSNLVEIDRVIYTGKTHTTAGGRDGGTSQSDDGRLNITYTIPGKNGYGTNPEQILAAGWSTCFIDSVKIVAAKMKIFVPLEFSVETEVDLAMTDDQYSIQARLNVNLPGVERAAGLALIEAAHRTCPYSKATRGNINVTINLL